MTLRGGKEFHGFTPKRHTGAGRNSTTHRTPTRTTSSIRSTPTKKVTPKKDHHHGSSRTMTQEKKREPRNKEVAMKDDTAERSLVFSTHRKLSKSVMRSYPIKSTRVAGQRVPVTLGKHVYTAIDYHSTVKDALYDKDTLNSTSDDAELYPYFSWNPAAVALGANGLYVPTKKQVLDDRIFISGVGGIYFLTNETNISIDVSVEFWMSKTWNAQSPVDMYTSSMPAQALESGPAVASSYDQAAAGVYPNIGYPPIDYPGSKLADCRAVRRSWKKIHGMSVKMTAESIFQLNFKGILNTMIDKQLLLAKNQLTASTNTNGLLAYGTTLQYPFMPGSVIVYMRTRGQVIMATQSGTTAVPTFGSGTISVVKQIKTRALPVLGNIAGRSQPVLLYDKVPISLASGGATVTQQLRNFVDSAVNLKQDIFTA